MDSLYQKGLVPLTRKTSLQREAARLDGERGQTAAAIAEAKSKISEAELQAMRVDQDFRTEVMKDLREAQDKGAELVEKTIAAHDLLKRVDLRAPTNEIVHQLSVHTIGGVITPGEVVMEIVPESDRIADRGQASAPGHRSRAPRAADIHSLLRIQPAHHAATRRCRVLCLRRSQSGSAG